MTDKVEILEREENTRVVLIGDYKMTLERRDPHGFWFVKWPKGTAPVVLQQAFTNLASAFEHIENWHNKLPPRLKPKLTKEDVELAKSL